jgi:hypothetical protein
MSLIRDPYALIHVLNDILAILSLNLDIIVLE